MTLYLFQELFSDRKSVRRVRVAVPPILVRLAICCEHRRRKKKRVAQILWTELVDPNFVHRRDRVQSVFQDVPGQVAKRLTQTRDVNTAVKLEPVSNHIPIPA